MQQYRLEVEGMCKSFPGVKALDHVSLRVKPGSVHALIGENGAGKSTLMKCLFGLYHPEEGTVKIDGEPVTITDSKAALHHGLSMIHQELNPVPYRNVMDNIWVGRFPKKGLVVDEKEMERKTTKLLQDLEFDIPCKTLAKNLSVSQLQAIEIAKSISYDAKIIIMDEPTSSLTGAETDHLFKLIRKLKAEGRSVIYISHKLEEIFEIADEITVMRDGQYVGSYAVGDITIDQLIALMVGRDMDERFPPNEHVVQEENILSVEHYTSSNPRSFRDVSFGLRKGEILGIGGLVGAQRTELVEAIFGLRPIREGKLTMLGKPIRNRSAREAISHGFALLTEERRATGIVPMLSVKDNALVAAYKKFVNNKLGVLNPRRLVQPVDQVCKQLDVRMASMNVQIKNLSGGNQQKVLVGRWLLAGCNILILDEPTRGVDVGAKYEIYKIMRQLVREGNSIIMVSSEMPELLGMSDRVMVMCEGRLSGILEGEKANQVEVMRLATAFSAKEEAVGG
ncbi:MAG: sugar ABC transporter ATP-binding protein [Candidatus Faecousia sp.]|nr:sugar ABC transporter ATP-binding protein [Candidatus Faecousia sp.]